ncbi:hypothetical protein [Falsirhodobacter sp. alg1]|uniref:hypothetical protein n=1 Tax=Falsirhodobacter sp. alg1 TaxID=1472418 RepID=UPI00178CDD3B|nr:hypothetical protein [Falsirhodobacter sp. alg1]
MQTTDIALNTVDDDLEAIGERILATIAQETVPDEILSLTERLQELLTFASTGG